MIRTLLNAVVLSFLVFGCQPSVPPIVEDQSTREVEVFNPNDYDQVLRRTTLVVRDIDKSLALYRDAIGMEVIYDQTLERPHPSGAGTQQVKLVFLKSVHEFYGVLGLMETQFGEEDKEVLPVERAGFIPGKTVLLFNTNDQEAGFAKISKLPDIEMYREPAIREYPSYDGGDPIRVKVCIFYDPDGVLVEYNQILSGM